MAHNVEELGTQVESLANQVNQIIKRLNLRIDDLSLTVDTLPDVEELRRLWNRIIELETQAKFSEDAVKELEEAREDYVNSFNDVFDRITNAPGMYNTVIENPGGGNTYYSHNKPTLDESDIIWMFTAGGIAVANGRDEEGKPDYKYGFTVDGDFIANAIKAKKIGGEHGYIDFGEGEINFNAGDGDFIHYYKDENGKGVLDINANTFQNGVATFVNTNYIAPVSEVANGAASAASAAQTTANGAMQKSDYLKAGTTTIDGGRIATNSITADKIIIGEVADKIKKIATFSGGGNTALYCKLCTIDTGEPYINTPKVITLNQRGNGYGQIHVNFISANNTDPTLDYCRASQNLTVYIHKSATSTWSVYVKKSQSWDSITVTDYSDPNNRPITWNCENANLPSGAIKADLLPDSVYNIYSSGTTTIDGGRITTNSITADKINVEEVFAKDLTATGNINFDNGYYSIKNDGNNVTIRTNKPASRLTVMGYAETWINGSDVNITSDIGSVSLSAPFGVKIAQSDLTVGKKIIGKQLQPKADEVWSMPAVAIDQRFTSATFWEIAKSKYSASDGSAYNSYLHVSGTIGTYNRKRYFELDVPRLSISGYPPVLTIRGTDDGINDVGFRVVEDSNGIVHVGFNFPASTTWKAGCFDIQAVGFDSVLAETTVSGTEINIKKIDLSVISDTGTWGQDTNFVALKTGIYYYHASVGSGGSNAPDKTKLADGIMIVKRADYYNNIFIFCYNGRTAFGQWKDSNPTISWKYGTLALS